MSRLIEALGDTNPVLLTVALAVVFGAGWHWWALRRDVARLRDDAARAELRDMLERHGRQP